MNPASPSAAYGYAGMGPYQGGQAEFVLVPSAIQSSGFSKFVKNIMEFSRAVVQAKKSCGVWTGAIDAVGYQARDDKNPSKENPTQALENCLRVVNSTGSVGIIGVFIAPDPAARDQQKKQGIFPFPLADFFSKGLTIGTGQAPVKKYNEYLRDLIISGRAKPSLIVSHRINIDQAPDAYSKFDQRTDGYTKVLIRFNEKIAA